MNNPCEGKSSAMLFCPVALIENLAIDNCVYTVSEKYCFVSVKLSVYTVAGYVYTLFIWFIYNIYSIQLFILSVINYWKQ